MNDIIFDWKFHQLEVVYDETLLSSVVKLVHWQYIAILSQSYGSTTSSTYGACVLPSPDPATFIPFLQLTKQELVTWVESRIGTSALAAMQMDLSGSFSMFDVTTQIPMLPPWE